MANDTKSVSGIENIEYLSLLYDFYGELLGDKEREVMDLHHEDDMSLSEIAEELGRTRQGVHYTLKKAEASLRHYEDKLGLVARHLQSRKLAREAEILCAGIASSKDLPDEIKKTVDSLAGMIRRFTE